MRHEVVAVSHTIGARFTHMASRRLVTVTAGPGWGKTTLVTDRLPSDTARWITARQLDRDAFELARGLLEQCGGTHGTDLDTSASTSTLAAEVTAAWLSCDAEAIVVDDADVLGGSEGLALLRELSLRTDAGRPLVVLSRVALDLVDDRRRGHADVLEIDAPMLALDLDATAELVGRDLADDRALAARIAAATGGWPVATRFVVEALHDVAADKRSAATETVALSSRPITHYLETVVLPGEAASHRRMLARLALVPDVTADELATLTSEHPSVVAGTLHDLVGRGLARADPDRPDRIDLAPVVRRFVEDHLLPELDPDGSLTDEVVDGLVTSGDVSAGLALLTTRNRHAATAALLEGHGHDLLRAGRLRTITDAASTLPLDHRTPEIEALHARALALRGDWAGAERCLEAAGVGPDGSLPTSLAVSLGLVHYVRGDLDAAVAAYARGPDHDRSDPEHAALASWRATAHWLRGEIDEARAWASSAMTTATQQADDRALAFAHTAVALLAANDGDRRANETHYRQALAAATRAGDGLQQARIHTNLGSHHLEEGEYAEALAETERAIDLSESQDFVVIMGVARCNRAEILLRTGALDEAIADAERAREVFAAMGSRTEAYAHHLLGAARTERGEFVLARQAYDRALRLAEPAGDRQALVPTYLGLARATVANDPDAARDAVERAMELDDGMTRAEVDVVAAWVAAAQGAVERARDRARAAIEWAEARSNPAVVAEAMTCLAVLDDDPVPGLQEARLLWRELHAPLWIARIELGLARRSSDPADVARVPDLERRLATLGCPSDRGAVNHRMVVGIDTHPRTLIRALGGFVVERDGRALPTSAWGSRKARELLKILVARLGRGITREELGHLLWPDEPYEKVSNRLSVALSIVRGVLAGGRSESGHHAIVTSGGTVRLDLDAVEIDVEVFQRLADEGLRAAREGRDGDATVLLLRAEELYGGDLVEDDPDADWVVDRRTALRSLYLTVARTLATLVAHHDPDLAIRSLLRVLDRDGYDEPAHLNLCVALVRAGRHGEARRRHRLYEDRMVELDLPAVAFHQVVREAGRQAADLDPSGRRAKPVAGAAAS